MRLLSSRFLTIARLLILCQLAALAAAAQGPPPHVERAVDAVVDLLRERSEEKLDTFVKQAIAPSWRDRDGEEALVELVREMRDAMPSSFDELAVEAAPGGVQLLVGSGGALHVLDVGISEAGITSLGLADPAGSGAGTGADAGDGDDTPTTRDAALRSHLRALETSHRQSLDELVEEFETRRLAEGFLAETTTQERRELLAKIREAAGQAGGALLDEDNGSVTLTLRARKREWRVQLALENQAPFRLTTLSIVEGDAADELALSWDNVGEVFADYAANGFSGVVHIARDGTTVLERAYGMANRELAYPNTVDTIFGIGSTPIDFTVAGLYLLAQRGELSLDDSVTEFFDEVPADKRDMTLRHLITGASGLPDFHDLPGDWDADLAWIDRSEAVRRILAQPLLFAPGTSRAHSHSAYGLAAAVLELVSGEGYEQFLRREIFEPAGMKATGMYGSTLGYELRDFAVGYGPSSVGLPNIPPNWGPTSWLVLGSGGMFSTVGDMLRFHRYMRKPGVLQGEYARRYLGERVGVGGSERGFYIFEALSQDGDVGMFLMNGEGRRDEIRRLSRAVERLVLGE